MSDYYGDYYPPPFGMDPDPFGRPRRKTGQWADSKWVDPSRTRDKLSHPYSYSEFFIFGNREVIKKEGVGGYYSDRLWQWWAEKKSDGEYNALWKKHVGSRYEHASSEQLGAFLTEYHKTLWPEDPKKFTVVALAEGCNPSNGYPYWVIWYKAE